MINQGDHIPTSLNSSTNFPSWLENHPSHNEEDNNANNVLFPSPLWALLYGIVTSVVVIILSSFLQLHRKISYSDWVARYKPSKSKNCLSGATRPPVVKGHFLLGNGREFAEDAAGFLQQVGREYGDVATIRLMFRHIAVLTDVHSFPAFGLEPRFDFNPIVDQVNLNVFGFKSHNNDDDKRRLYSFYKSSRMHDSLVRFDEYLTQAMSSFNPPEREIKANDFTVNTAFQAVFRTLLGNNANVECLRDNDYLHYYNSYRSFIKYFNFLWLGLPLRLFPKAKSAFNEMVRVHPKVSDMPSDESICGYLRKAAEKMIAEGHNDAEIIGHNIEFIHVHINAIRLAYWILLFILSDTTAYETLQEEIDTLIKQRQATCGEGHTVSIELSDVDSMKALNSIFTEALRLVSGVLVIRGVTQDVTFKTASGNLYDLKRGESILFYPPSHHYDEEIFEEPHSFKWDRFLGESNFQKNGIPVKKPVMGFGQLCIGQRFATYLSKWYLVRILNSWKFSLTGEVPKVDLNFQGHEILPPKTDTTITCQRRSSEVAISLSRHQPNSVNSMDQSSLVACHTAITEDCSNSWCHKL